MNDNLLFKRNKRSDNHYRGRFAPSPSGNLHFGSLVAALASFLDAKFHQGTWLVRIEDIDPPREVKGASGHILKTLEKYGLHWDEDVLYQSGQSDYYNDILAQLTQQKLSYFCRCTRADIKAIGGVYQGHCKNLKHSQNNSAIRIINSSGIHSYQDLFQEKISTPLAFAQEDFIIKRKDGLFAYQLAVVLDDIYQGVSHVIRGCDLLEPTARQLSFFDILHQVPPIYGHVPLAIDEQGYKLSKQNKAPEINPKHPQDALFSALTFLGQSPPQELIYESVDSIIAWGIKNWQRCYIPPQQKIIFSP